MENFVLLYNVFRVRRNLFMYIRTATVADLNQILEIYETGRKYMRSNGNLTQWNDGYPSKELLSDDIDKGQLFVVCDDVEIICVYAFIEGPDITYKKIYNGAWPDDRQYYVIHRIAVAHHRKGIASFVFNHCLELFPVIRIDTHKDNIPMRNSLEKNGFKYCGIIHLLNGDERLAYQKER